MNVEPEPLRCLHIADVTLPRHAFANTFVGCSFLFTVVGFYLKNGLIKINCMLICAGSAYTQDYAIRLGYEENISGEDYL